MQSADENRLAEIYLEQMAERENELNDYIARHREARRQWWEEWKKAYLATLPKGERK